MRHKRLKLGLLLVALTPVVVVGCLFRRYFAAILPSSAAEVGDLKLPPGFAIAVYADGVANARQMALGPPGIVFVGSRSEGKVYAVVDRDGKHRADEVHVLASGLDMPSGVAFREGALYVAEKHGIGAGKLIHPLRLALTGRSVSPPVFDVAAVLGKDRTLRRLRRLIDQVPQLSAT